MLYGNYFGKVRFKDQLRNFLRCFTGIAKSISVAILPFVSFAIIATRLYLISFLHSSLQLTFYAPEPRI